MKRLFLLLFLTLALGNVFAQATYQKLFIASDSIKALSDDYFAVAKNGKWAVFKNKTQILDFYYDDIDVLSDGVITFIKNSQAGFADLSGKILSSANYALDTPFQMSEDCILNVFSNGSALVYDGTRLVLLDKNCKPIKTSDCEIIAKQGNIVIFKKDGAYGLMDAKGNIIAKNKYRRIQSVIAGELYAYTGQKNGVDVLGLISSDGRELSKAEYDDLTIISKNDKFYVKGFVSTGKQALYDAKGNLLFQPLYQSVEPTNIENYYNIVDNTKKGIIGADYSIYVPAEYDNVFVVTPSDDTIFVAIKENKNYILSKDGKTIDELNGNIKDFISYKNNEAIYIADSMLNYGVRSSKQGWMVEPKYLDIFADANGTLVVRQTDKWGAIDFNDNVVIPFEYNKVRAPKNKSYIVYYDGKKNSIVLLQNGKQLEFPKVENVLPLENAVEYTFKKEKIRLYLNGKELKGGFKTISSEKDGLICAEDKKGWTYFNASTLDRAANQYFEYATAFNNNCAFVIKDKKLAMIDCNFNIIETILDENYVGNRSTAAVLSMSDKLQKNNLVVKDKNGKATLIKIVKQ